MRRSNSFCTLALAAAFAATAINVPAPTLSINTLAAAEVTGLKDQLEKGLKARRPEEFQFIAVVVGMVEQNRLPLELVQSTFFWARQHPKAKKLSVSVFRTCAA